MIAPRFSLVVLLFAFNGCGAGEDAVKSPMRKAPDGVAAIAYQRSSKELPEDRVEAVPVTSILRLSQPTAKQGEEIQLIVEFQVAPTWEIHTLNAQDESTATRLEVIVPAGIALKGPWNEPRAMQSVAPARQVVHVGKAVFKRTLSVDSDAHPGAHQIECLVSFQACNEQHCLQPEERTLKAPLVIDSP